MQLKTWISSSGCIAQPTGEGRKPAQNDPASENRGFRLTGGLVSGNLTTATACYSPALAGMRAPPLRRGLLRLGLGFSRMVAPRGAANRLRNCEACRKIPAQSRITIRLDRGVHVPEHPEAAALPVRTETRLRGSGPLWRLAHGPALGGDTPRQWRICGKSAHNADIPCSTLGKPVQPHAWPQNPVTPQAACPAATGADRP